MIRVGDFLFQLVNAHQSLLLRARFELLSRHAQTLADRASESQLEGRDE